MAEASLPTRLTRAHARIARLGWLSVVPTHFCECTGITLGASPLIRAHASCARVVGHPVFAHQATFVASWPSPVSFAVAATAIFAGRAMIALVEQPALSTVLPSPVKLAAAFRTHVIR